MGRTPTFYTLFEELFPAVLVFQYRFSALDGLRGAAAVLVAVYHFYYSFPSYLTVDFFPVLSGFGLTHRYLYETLGINPREFIGRRLSRLYPLHLFTLAT